MLLGGIDISVELNKYQIEAINNLSNGKILLGGVGSGKSRTALAYYYIKECDGKIRINDKLGSFSKPKKPKPLYIITTARKRDKLDWDGEMAPFMLSTNQDISVSHIKVTVDSWNNIKKYTSVTGAFFIFDEDRVSSYGAWSKAFIKIANANRWIICTATPGDDLMQYMPIFIANGFYRNKSDFVRQHCVYSQWAKYPKIDHYVGVKKLMAERDSLIVELETDRLTHRNYHDVSVAYDRAKYRIVMRDRWNPFDEKPIENISQLCYLLRKVVNSDSTRTEWVKQIVRSHPKVIIFYNYDYELELLRQACNEINVTHTEWNGHHHEDIPKTDSWVYLCNYGSCAEGWNCIETDTMIFYSQSYSYKTMVQAAGRIDRMNTPFIELYYYILKSKAPIDLAISRCLKKKKDFNESKFVI